MPYLDSSISTSHSVPGDEIFQYIDIINTDYPMTTTQDLPTAIMPFILIMLSAAVLLVNCIGDCILAFTQHLQTPPPFHIKFNLCNHVQSTHMDQDSSFICSLMRLTKFGSK